MADHRFYHKRDGTVLTLYGQVEEEVMATRLQGIVIINNSSIVVVVVVGGWWQ